MEEELVSETGNEWIPDCWSLIKDTELLNNFYGTEYCLKRMKWTGTRTHFLVRWLISFFWYWLVSKCDLQNKSVNLEGSVI